MPNYNRDYFTGRYMPAMPEGKPKKSLDSETADRPSTMSPKDQRDEGERIPATKPAPRTK